MSKKNDRKHWKKWRKKLIEEMAEYKKSSESFLKKHAGKVKTKNSGKN